MCEKCEGRGPLGPWGPETGIQKRKGQQFTFDKVLYVVQSVVSDSLQPHGLQHARLPCPSPSLGVCSNSCPMSQ